MTLTFDELVTTKTKEQWRDQILLALQGIGYITKSGFGTGSLSASGTATDSLDIVVDITTLGGVGVAVFRYSIDGGVTWEASGITVPGGGSYVIPDTGVTILFVDGSEGNSFEVGDDYSFTIATPTFQATSWQVGSTPRTLVEVDADVDADLSQLIKNIAKGGLLEQAEDDWLDLLVQSFYDEERNLGAKTVGTVTLTDATSAGPFTIVPGQLWVGTSLGYRYTNTSGGTLTLGSTLDLEFTAEASGTVYNVGENAIVVMFTSLPGVTVNNPDSDWITTQGRDRETDAQLRARMKLKWPSLGIGSVASSYELWAMTASANVTRVKVSASITVPGDVDVLLAGPSGGVDGATVTTVEDYITPRVPLCSAPNIVSASTLTLTVAVTAYIRSGYEVQAALDIEANVNAYLSGGTNTIGEALEGVDIGGTIYITEIVEQIQIVAGVRNITLTLNAGTVDINLGATQVAALTLNLTPVTI